MGRSRQIVKEQVGGVTDANSQPDSIVAQYVGLVNTLDKKLWRGEGGGDSKKKVMEKWEG